MLPKGTVLGTRYRVSHQIGMGGLGFVYRADDWLTNKPVVVKVLRPDTSSSGMNSMERLQHEAQILAKLHHPNIVPYVEFRQDRPWTYLVVEWVPGESLQQGLRVRQQPYSSQEVTPWLGALCDTLGYLGQHDIVHRDLKPHNVLITPEGRLVLIDFNVAMDLSRAAQDPYAREPVGTPTYAAPEQMARRAVDLRADVYALGTILYEMLTLTRPFAEVERSVSREERWERLKDAKTSRDPPSLAGLRPDLPVALVAVVDRALTRRPEDRWPSAQALWHAWIEALGGPSLNVLPAKPNEAKDAGSPEQRSGRGAKVGVAVTAVLIIGLLGLAGLLVIDGNVDVRPTSQPSPTSSPPPSTRVAQLVEPVCQKSSLVDEVTGTAYTWQTCIRDIELSEANVGLRIDWSMQMTNRDADVTKLRDVGNDKVYLIDAGGDRHDANRFAGAAAEDTKMVSGRTATGWFWFPTPIEMDGPLTFVDDDTGQKLVFKIQ